MCASFSIVVDAFSWPYYYTFGLVLLLLLLVMVLGTYIRKHEFRVFTRNSCMCIHSMKWIYHIRQKSALL